MAIKPDVQRAAKILADIINRQGKNLDRSSYARKTGAFTAILDNFKQPDAQVAITLLGIADVVQHLSDAQQAFEWTPPTRIGGAKRVNTYFFITALPASTADVAINDPINANECGILD
jgi:hypothetical protein